MWFTIHEPVPRSKWQAMQKKDEACQPHRVMHKLTQFPSSHREHFKIAFSKSIANSFNLRNSLWVESRIFFAHSIAWWIIEKHDIGGLIQLLAFEKETVKVFTLNLNLLRWLPKFELCAILRLVGGLTLNIHFRIIDFTLSYDDRQWIIERINFFPIPIVMPNSPQYF